MIRRGGLTEYSLPWWERVRVRGERKFLLAFIISLTFFLFPISARAQELAVDDVARKLVCQCGCQSVLPACIHSECESATPMKATIKDRIGRGMNKDFLRGEGKKNF